jgi:hypothetical protein
MRTSMEINIDTVQSNESWQRVAVQAGAAGSGPGVRPGYLLVYAVMYPASQINQTRVGGLFGRKVPLPSLRRWWRW